MRMQVAATAQRGRAICLKGLLDRYLLWSHVDRVDCNQPDTVRAHRCMCAVLFRVYERFWFGIKRWRTQPQLTRGPTPRPRCSSELAQQQCNCPTQTRIPNIAHTTPRPQEDRKRSIDARSTLPHQDAARRRSGPRK